MAEYAAAIQGAIVAVQQVASFIESTGELMNMLFIWMILLELSKSP